MKLKKAKLYKWLWLLPPILAIVVPFLVLWGSQTSLNSSYVPLISIDNQLKNDGKKYSSYKARVSLKELVYGTKKPTDGNYVIFLALAGGNSAPTITSNWSKNDAEGTAYPSLTFNKTLNRFFSADKLVSDNPIYYNEYDDKYKVNNIVTSTESPFIIGINESKYFRDINAYGDKRANISFYTLFKDYEKINYGYDYDFDVGGENQRKFTKQSVPLSPYYSWSVSDETNAIFNGEGYRVTQKASDLTKDQLKSLDFAKAHESNKEALESNSAKRYRELIKNINNLSDNSNFNITSEELHSGIVALTWVKGVPHSKIFLNYNTTYTNPFLKLTNEWTSYLDSIYSTVSKD